MAGRKFLEHKNVYIAPSKIHGRGIFAKRNFKRGERVMLLRGRLKHLKITSKEDSQMGPNWVGIKKNFWIDPISPILYLNHSCDNPNIGIKGKITFVALRDIKKGEEITIDYAITEDDTLWQFQCLCEAKNCRKVIRSIQYLPNRIYKRYLPYVPTYFKKVYNKANAH